MKPSEANEVKKLMQSFAYIFSLGLSQERKRVYTVCHCDESIFNLLNC
ncbi:Uncharacterised protein [Providencia rettgeri]|nr:Uncharacterised protein [Providencia rettgeri]